MSKSCVSTVETPLSGFLAVRNKALPWFFSRCLSRFSGVTSEVRGIFLLKPAPLPAALLWPLPALSRVCPCFHLKQQRGARLWGSGNSGVTPLREHTCPEGLPGQAAGDLAAPPAHSQLLSAAGRQVSALTLEAGKSSHDLGTARSPGDKGTLGVMATAQISTALAMTQVHIMART